MLGYIYKYHNRINNKVYIGQTTDLINRKSSHRNKSRYKKNKFYNAVRKYGWESFDFTIIEAINEEESIISEILDKLEIKYISIYNSYYEGYNSTPGGHSARGMKRSEKFREYCRKRQYSRETRLKMSIAAKNKKVSEVTKNKLRAIAKTVEHFQNRDLYKEKTDKAKRKALAKPIIQLDNNNNIINEFEALIDSAKYIQNNIAPHLTISGIQRTLIRRLKDKTNLKLYYGFLWKYKNQSVI